MNEFATRPHERLPEYTPLHWTEHAVIAWLLVDPSLRTAIPQDAWEICHARLRPIADAVYHFGGACTMRLVADLLELRGQIVIGDGSGTLGWFWGLPRDLILRSDDEWRWPAARDAFLDRARRRRLARGNGR